MISTRSKAQKSVRLNPRIGARIVLLLSLRRPLLMAAAMAFLLLPGNDPARADLMNDSIEDLSIRFIDLNENVIKPPFCSGTTVYVQAIATLEDAGKKTYKEFGALNDGGGLMSWTSSKGQIIATVGNFPADSYKVPVTATSTTDTITLSFWTETKSYFSDREEATKAVPVVNCNNPQAVAPAPNPPVFAAAGNGFDFLVPVTLTNPFPQALIVDAVAIATPSLDPGVSDSKVFNPFALALNDGTFYLSPNSSVTATIGISFPSSLDQDMNLRLGGALEDGTPVQTPLMMLETVDSSSSLSGSFETVPEPGSFVLAAMGVAGLIALGWRRRKR